MATLRCGFSPIYHFFFSLFQHPLSTVTQNEALSDGEGREKKLSQVWCRCREKLQRKRSHAVYVMARYLFLSFGVTTRRMTNRTHNNFQTWPSNSNAKKVLL